MAPTTYVCAKCEKVYSSKSSLYKHLYGYVDNGKRMPAMCPVPDGEFFRGGRCAVLRSDFKRDITKREFDKEVAFTHSTRYPRPSDDKEPSQVAEDTVRSEDFSVYQAPTDDDIEAITDPKDLKAGFKRAARAWRYERDQPARKRKKRESSPHECYVYVKKKAPLDNLYIGRGLEKYDMADGKKWTRHTDHAKDERKAARLSGRAGEARVPIKILGGLDFFQAAQGEETIYRMFERHEQAGKTAPPQYLPFVKNAAGSWEQVTHERMQKAWSVIFVYRMREEFPELVPMPARPIKSKR